MTTPTIDEQIEAVDYARRHAFIDMRKAEKNKNLEAAEALGYDVEGLRAATATLRTMQEPSDEAIRAFMVAADKANGGDGNYTQEHFDQFRPVLVAGLSAITGEKP